MCLMWYSCSTFLVVCLLVIMSSCSQIPTLNLTMFLITKTRKVLSLIISSVPELNWISRLTSNGRTSTEVLKSLSPGCSIFPLRKKYLKDKEFMSISISFRSTKHFYIKIFSLFVGDSEPESPFGDTHLSPIIKHEESELVPCVGLTT